MNPTTFVRFLINNLQEDGLEGSVIGEKLRELRLNKIKEELKRPK